jgi:hypothetical protein
VEGFQVKQPLAVRVLEVIEYPPGGHGYDTHIYPMPSWEQIEAAIRALDHYCLPFFFIGLRDTCEGEDCFSVLGGPNGYAITAEVKDLGWVQYCDPSHTGGPVDVWTSDQGFYPDEKYVAYDVELVVRLTRYYAEHGQLDPSVQWEA